MNEISSVILPPLIGICGKKGVGKDTVADHLTVVFGYKRMSFADPIKEGLSAMFRAPLTLFNDPYVKEAASDLLCGHSPRYLMQTLGTEWGRDLVDTDLWVKLMLRRIAAEHDHGNHLIVVPDVRFDSEASAIKKAGGVLWEVTRPDPVYAAGDTHRSEAGVDRSLVDVTIVNNHDMRMLFTQVGLAIKNARPTSA